MPINSAATSMSRIAIHERPKRPRTRFFAPSASTVTIASASNYFAAGAALDPVISTPKKVRGGTVICPVAL